MNYKLYKTSYQPSKRRQLHLLKSEKRALQNRKVVPISANNSLQLSKLTPAGYFILGLLFSSVLLPEVSPQKNTTPLTERNALLPNIDTACQDLIHSLQNTTRRAGCLLIPGDHNSLHLIQSIAFGNHTIKRQQKPSDSGINYRSHQLIELCINTSTAKALDDKQLCNHVVLDPLMEYEVTESLYRENQKSPTEILLPENIECMQKNIIGISANERSVSYLIKEQECYTNRHPQWLALQKYQYPLQDKRPIINPRCPQSLLLLSDGIASQDIVQTQCLPINIHNGKSLCQEIFVSKFKECKRGLVTNAQDCILGNNVYTVLKKECPHVKITDMRVIHHQRIDDNKTIPMIATSSLIKAMDICIEQGCSHTILYITHPGTQIFTTPKITALLQKYIDTLKTLHCSIILDTCNRLLPNNDPFKSLKNIIHVNSMKEALEEGFPQENNSLPLIIIAIISSGLVLTSGFLYIVKTKKQPIEENTPQEEIPLTDTSNNSILNEAVQFQEKHKEEDFSETISLLYIDHEDETPESLFQKTRGLSPLEGTASHEEESSL